MPIVRWEPFQDVGGLQDRLYRMLGSAVERSWMPAQIRSIMGRLPSWPGWA